MEMQPVIQKGFTLITEILTRVVATPMMLIAYIETRLEVGLLRGLHQEVLLDPLQLAGLQEFMVLQRGVLA
jgi:hypothetical protein